MFVSVNGHISQEEKQAYIQRGQEQFGSNLDGIIIDVDGDEVELHYQVRSTRFERIRRITGYLVGDMGKWNNAKRAEERDRVRHPIG